MMEGLLNILSSVLREYLGTRTDDFKKKVVIGLSIGFSRTLAILIMGMLAVVLLSVLAFAFTLVIGEAIGSFSAAAFIVAGAYFLVFAVLYILRKRLFLKMFARVFSGIADDASPTENFKALALIMVQQIHEHLADS